MSTKMETTKSVFKPVFTNRILDGKAFMLLDKHIGPDGESPNRPFIDGPRFAEEMYWLKAQGNDIVVKINSPGGRVDHGWSIIDAIMETGATTHLVGLGASMAGICFLFGKKRIANEHATLMLHGPRGGSKQYIEIVKSQFSNLISSFSKLPKEKAEAIIASGDHFFDISDMEEYGFADEVKRTDVKFIKPNTTNAHVLYEAYASVINEPTKTQEMELLANLFGKKTESENLVAAVEMKAENEALKTKASTLETENKDLKTKIAALEAAAKAGEAKTKGKELIEAAIKAGKMTFKDDAAKEKAIENATANYDAVKEMIDSMPSQKKFAAVAAVDHTGKNEQLTYEYLAKNDPQKLAQIAETDTELFAKLQDEYLAKSQEQK